MKESGPPKNTNKSGTYKEPDGTIVWERTDGIIHARHCPDGTIETYDHRGRLWRTTYPDGTAKIFDVETGETIDDLDRNGKSIPIDNAKPGPVGIKRSLEPVVFKALTKAEEEELEILEGLDAKFEKWQKDQANKKS